jgi:glucosamine-6-phosphate deaminase
MPHDTDRPVAQLNVDALSVRVYPDRPALGRAAARHVAAAIAERISRTGRARLIFAAAPSQNEFLACLARDPSIPWPSVVAFHMDEYLGLGPEHPASFRRYLRQHLFDSVGLTDSQLRLIAGKQSENPLQTCLDYAALLKAEPPDILCAGIGENGHLAFNDPPVADFLDPVPIKVVRLDHTCRVQQVHDGGFDSIDAVPRHAYTLTLPALLAAPIASVVVPGPRKAQAVRDALRGPIDESCPASALRRHPGAILWLDTQSAELVL